MLTLVALLLSISAIPQGVSQSSQPARLVTVGSHNLLLNCTGDASGPAVILEAGTGDTSEVWSAVQKEVEKFARVCSYDRLGLGKSDKLTPPHTADEIVNDMHGLLHDAPVSPPYDGRAFNRRNLRSQVCRALSDGSDRYGVARLRARGAIL